MENALRTSLNCNSKNVNQIYSTTLIRPRFRNIELILSTAWQRMIMSSKAISTEQTCNT